MSARLLPGEDPSNTKPFRVIVEPSVFRVRDTFVLGYYRTKIGACWAAFWSVKANPHALAVVEEKRLKSLGAPSGRSIGV